MEFEKAEERELSNFLWNSRKSLLHFKIFTVIETNTTSQDLLYGNFCRLKNISVLCDFVSLYYEN